MRHIFSFLLIALIKLLASLFYRFKVNWIGGNQLSRWREVRIIVFLNHTSLFEPLFLKLAPYGFIWKLSRTLVVPGADITLQRPILGKFIKLLIPGCLPITRKNDETWAGFLKQMKADSVVAILPEGRMKRKNGLDKSGKPMSVRGGTSDILQFINDGKILFVYSGGLHHIQSPGDKLPRLFKTIKVTMEMLDVTDYKKHIIAKNHHSFKRAVMEDLNYRLQHCVPKDDE
ncbi:MAG TPA: hypothetical protein ENJ60_16030 [Aeromonadales bacterium]|nr:hypothetical protein [Aeromonadales bacterium]